MTSDPASFLSDRLHLRSSIRVHSAVLFFLVVVLFLCVCGCCVAKLDKKKKVSKQHLTIFQTEHARVYGILNVICRCNRCCLLLFGRGICVTVATQSVQIRQLILGGAVDLCMFGGR